MPRAFITGITGQDGSYLAEFLLSRGYEVHGLVRRTCEPAHSALAHLLLDTNQSAGWLHLHPGDLHDTTNLRRILHKIRADEVYHLASQTHAGLSFEIPEVTCELAGMATIRLLEILRDLENPQRFFHASSSEVFGTPHSSPQNEETPYAPVTPYGCAKALASQMVAVYRRNHGLFACNGILYNHESPRRGSGFVTRKIAAGVARIKVGLQSKLKLGNIDASRDWGFAGDYVEGMWLILQHPKPGDYVLASGEAHSVRDFLELAFAHVGLRWEDHVEFDSRLVRVAEGVNLVGDPGKATAQLGWKRRVSFQELVAMMVDCEMAKAQSKSQNTQARSAS